MRERGERIDVDVAVIGAGPAGLAAAAAAAARGCAVAVFDESQAPGGRLPGQLHRGRDGRWHSGRDDARRLRAAAEQAGARIFTATSVWGLEPEWEVFLAPAGDGPRACRAGAVVLATGAGEVPAPLPGWTLPGVLTPGAVQTLVNVHGVLPGRRALIAGLGPLGLEAAQLLDVAGAEIVGVHAAWQGALGAPHTPGEALRELVHTVGDAAPSRLMRLGGRVARNAAVAPLAARLAPSRVAGIPLSLDEVVVGLRGDGRVEQALLAPLRSDGTLDERGRRTVDVDVVCLGGGLRPLVELTGSCGCELVDLPGLSGPVPLHGERQQTTAPGLFAAGGATGVEGAAVCERQGALAGLAAAAHLGAPAVEEAALAAARAAIVRARREAPVRFHRDLPAGRRQMQDRWEDACRTTT